MDSFVFLNCFYHNTRCYIKTGMYQTDYVWYIPAHIKHYKKFSAHAFSSVSPVPASKRLPLRRSAPLQESANSVFVFPISLPPDVANGMIVLPSRW